MKTKLNFLQTLKAGVLAILVAATMNSLLFFIFHAAGIIVDTIEVQPGQPLTVVPVIISSVVPSIVAILVFFLLERVTKNGLKIFTIIAIILMVLSFANPFTMIKDVTPGYGIVLNLMHVVVVFSLLFFLRRAKQKIQ